MNKRLIFLVGLLAATLFAVGVGAQESDDPITLLDIGETASGEISDVNFEDVYQFEGEAGSLVSIRMTAGNGFDTKLYLTTTGNELLAENDDFFGLNSLIIYRLPSTDTYQVVATRLGDRFGGGTGPYTLEVANVESIASGVTQEGSFEPEGETAFYLFVPEASGDYTVSYRWIRGDFFPTVRIRRFNDEYSYTESIAAIEGSALRGGSLTLSLEADVVYVVGLENAYYGDGSTPTVFTLSVEATDAE